MTGDLLDAGRTTDDSAPASCWSPALEALTGLRAEDVASEHCSRIEVDRRPAWRCTITSRCGTQIEVVQSARPAGPAAGLPDRLEGTVARLPCRTPGRSSFHGLIGHAPSMQRLYDLLCLAAKGGSSVLITGETGTGKELAAAALHAASPRARGPLVRVSCAALSEGLLESELFGHVRGAFTGAIASRQGRFEAADGGTLVLDEIGDVSLSVQTKLLRVLQEREVERVGSNRTIGVDVRVVASTNQDLLALCDAGRFRRDLYFRLAVIPVHVPALRERRSDIPLLIEHFVGRLCRAQGRPPLGVTPAAMACLVDAPWPGNVRELEHALEYALVVARGERIDLPDLPATVTGPPPALQAQASAVPPAAPRRSPRPDRDALQAALAAEGGHRGATAERLGVSRMTLWRWMRDLDLLET